MNGAPDTVATIDAPGEPRRWIMSLRLLESDPRLPFLLGDGWELAAKEQVLSVAVPVVLLRWDRDEHPPVRW